MRGRKDFSQLGRRRVCEEILLQVVPVTEEHTRNALVDNVSREQVECGVDAFEAFTKKPPLFPLGGNTRGPVKQTCEILRRRFPISRLVATANHDI